MAPAASICAAARTGGHWQFALGAAGRRSVQQPDPVDPSVLFDLASLSKPLVALTAARLAQQGQVALDAPLGSLLEEARATASAPISLQQLLAHRAGLVPHRTLYAPLLQGRTFNRQAALHRAASARRAECQRVAPPAGFPALYSDLGYLLAGAALAQVTGSALDDLVAREVCEPLIVQAGSARQWIARQRDFVFRVAPTEIVPWRGGELVGVVHDENAWALAGHGLAGHAGLFATAEGVARVGAAVLDARDGQRTDWLTAAALRPLLHRGDDSPLRAGFDSTSGCDSSAGAACGPATFGHLGFTGTSLWCDPEAQIVTVLLTNRVNPTRDCGAIRRARPQVHDALFHAACSLRQAPTGGEWNGLARAPVGPST